MKIMTLDLHTLRVSELSVYGRTFYPNDEELKIYGDIMSIEAIVKAENLNKEARWNWNNTGFTMNEWNYSDDPVKVRFDSYSTVLYTDKKAATEAVKDEIQKRILRLQESYKKLC